MGETTGIAWCDKTFNPWIGCTKVSAGCANCYAENLMDKRWGRAKWGKGNPRTRTSVKNWNDPIRWNKTAGEMGIRFKVFCASLADVFDIEVDMQWRKDLFHLIEKTPNLDWLILTKRPEVARDFLNVWGTPPHAWIGVSAEDQATADERIPILLKIDAKVRWISYEPALGPINFRPWLPDPGLKTRTTADWKSGAAVHWIIVGGESTQGMPARPFDVAWAIDTIAQCRDRAACFVKQIGGNAIESVENGRKLFVPTVSASGKDPMEWPKEIRVREFPVMR